MTIFGPSSRRGGRRCARRARVVTWAFAILLGSASAIAYADFVGKLPANTVLGNSTGATADARALPVPSCPDSGGNHLNWVAGSGYTCGTSAGASGITELTSDVTAGPGSGSQAATLAASGVVAGTYTKLTVDAKGRATVGATAACADLSDDGEGCSSATRTANTVLSGPASGSAAAPTFRALVALDVPATPLTAGTSVSLVGPRQYYVCTGTCTVTPPVPVAGYEFCVVNDNNVATVITLAALGSSARYENTARTAYGTAGTGTFVSGGAVGDKVCIVGRDSTHYLTTTFQGTWTAS